MTTRAGDVGKFVDNWARAEQRGDATTLNLLLHEDFVGVTDHGRTLDKRAWIARYRSGCLVHHAFCWHTTFTRLAERSAFVIGHLDHASSFRGHDASRRGTVTLALNFVTRDHGWRLTGLHADEHARS